MNLEDIGVFLKTEREKRGLTLDDVAARLKINPRLLAALESGKGQGLPHQAYVRGFIRSYAGLLGIGHEETQALLTGSVPETAPRPAPEAELPEPERHGSSGGRALAIFVILACIGGGCWWLWQSGYFKNILEINKEQPASIEEKLPGADAYLAAREAQERAEDRKSQEAAPAEPAPVDTMKPAAEEPALPAEQAADEQENAAPAPRQEPALPEEPAQHKLILTAVEECWVHSNADKTDTRQFSLRKGDTFALTFSKSLELKLGNAGGVRLRYDGNDLPPPGSSGQVKTVSFPPKNN